MAKAVAIVSGGMDSVTMLYRLLFREFYEVSVVTFNYGQRHKREIIAAAQICNHLGVKQKIVDISNLQELLKGSSLTDDSVDVPHGYYAEENMRKTVVPNRNMIMLAIAAGWAVSQKADVLATAIHAGDHYIYPDCRPAFFAALNAALISGNEGHAAPTFHLYAPYLYVTKVEIAKEGSQLGVPYELTWTCYEGGDVHCGVCGACQERRAGFREAGVVDPTVYASHRIYGAADVHD